MDQAQTDKFDGKLDELDGKLDDVVAEADKKLCPDGTFWNKAKEACTATTLVLSETETKCTADANGLIVLDEKGKPAVCNGEKKEYKVLGSGSALLGLTEDEPAASCATLEASSVFVLKTAKFWVERDGATFQTFCEFKPGGNAVDAGGDGSSEAAAAKDCYGLYTHWGKRKKASFYIKGKGDKKQECDFPFLGFPAETLKFEGQVNKHVYITTSTISKGANTLAILGKSHGFEAGNHVMIHQTMTTASGNEGQWEWNVIKALDGHANGEDTKVTLVHALQKAYMSGGGNSFADSNARAAQLVTVPYAEVGVVTAKLTTPAWDGWKGGIIALRTTKSLTVNKQIDAKCAGFRGGYSHAQMQSGGGCRAHQSAGVQGESYRGLGRRDGNSAGFSCCSGPSNVYAAPNGYNGRGNKNFGGGGGGAGACHGGGGAGGAHGGWADVKVCKMACRKGKTGDGAPECNRAGSWSMRGVPYGDGDDVVNFGSGGGGGNSYSPQKNEDNRVRHRQLYLPFSLPPPSS